jgi:hypothetical protein
MKKTALEPGSDVRIVNVCVVYMGDGIPQLTRIGILGGAPVGTESAVRQPGSVQQRLFDHIQAKNERLW